jgi:hypothetical protein
MRARVIACALLSVAAASGRLEAKQSPSDQAWQQLTVDVPEAPRRPTTRTKSCELGGTLKLRSASFYASETAKAPVFGVSRAEVARLRPAAARAQRIPLRIEWPVVAEGWLEADSLPFELAARVDVVKDHLWLGEGARVSAHAAGDGQIRIVRPGAEAGSPRPFPDGYEGVVRCETLAPANVRPFPSLPPRTAIALAGQVDFSPAPGRPRIASFFFGTGVEVRVLERRQGWIRAGSASSSMEPDSYGYLPFDFDAWTPEPKAAKFDGILGALLTSPAAPTHVATAEAPLRHGPSRSAAVIARLARGAPFVAGRRSQSFVAIKLPNLDRFTAKGDFWLAESDLSASAKATSP